MKHILPLLCTLLLLFHPHPSHAHNGAVAIAVPVEGIVVDGDLSDWPEGMRKYEIDVQEGAILTGEDDFVASFMVAFDEKDNALFVAVEIQDDSVIPISQGDIGPYTQDGCELYIEINHSEENVSPIQYFYRSSNLGIYSLGSVEDIDVAVRWGDNGYWFEWRIDIDRVT